MKKILIVLLILSLVLIASCDTQVSNDSSNDNTLSENNVNQPTELTDDLDLVANDEVDFGELI